MAPYAHKSRVALRPGGEGLEGRALLSHSALAVPVSIAIQLSQDYVSGQSGEVNVTLTRSSSKAEYEKPLTVNVVTNATDFPPTQPGPPGAQGQKAGQGQKAEAESGTGPILLNWAAPPTSERSSPGRGILISAHLSRATRGTIGRL